MLNRRLRGIWHGLRSRCENKNHAAYKYYGARGIHVCDEWSKFKLFLQWSIDNGYEENLEIDRIDNDLGYSPSNCRWTTRSSNARNTRKLREDNISGFRGVTYVSDKKKWMSYIKVNSKQKTLGYSKCRACAALMYDTYVLENSLEHTRNF